MNIGSGGASPVEAKFRAAVEAMEKPRVLELGTKRSEATFATHHKAWVPHAAKYVMSDIEDGEDVDVVADAHHLCETFKSDEFNVVIAVSTWEHLRYPWEAAAQLAEVLNHHGHCYIATHQTFPIHGYPSDFFRFTTDGLSSCMEWGGFNTIDTSYAYPCHIIPPPDVTRWNPGAAAFLNVDWYGVNK
jgi:SAM-dependent methyltransferase